MFFKMVRSRSEFWQMTGRGTRLQPDLFVRSLVGLDRAAATEAFGRFLDDGRFTVEQIRFVDLIVDELTTNNGVMERRRLFESPYTDRAPTGPDSLFSDTDVDELLEPRRHRVPREARRCRVDAQAHLDRSRA